MEIKLLKSIQEAGVKPSRVVVRQAEVVMGPGMREKDIPTGVSPSVMVSSKRKARHITAPNSSQLPLEF